MTALPLSPRLALFAALLIGQTTALAGDAVTIGSRRELFVDNHLIDRLSDGVSLQAQQPEPREVVLVTGESWEGNTSAYYTILHDGERFRMYYRGSHSVDRKGTHPEVTCYAESTDGRRWNKPRLGLHEWDGSTDNNIILTGIGVHCFTPFLDANPDCPPEARFKAVSRGRPEGEKGLYTFRSPDGIRWSLLRDEPVITQGAFDSQNLAFWDPVDRQYVAYSRTFTDGVRAIQRSVSDDFVHWSDPELLQYPGAPAQHLYTNAIRPCPGAPHIRIGFPTRYLPQTQQVEPIFMASRDGLTFHRFPEAVIPQTAPEDRDGNRSNYMANGLVTLPDFPDEWTVYATEAYYAGPDSRLRRFVYRRDGLAALTGTGEMLTRPLSVSGQQLRVNYRCRPGGELRIAVCDESGAPMPGLSSDDCRPLTGDALEAAVHWKSADIPSNVMARPIRLRFELRDADVFAFQFAAD